MADELVAQLTLGDDHATSAELAQVGLLGLRVGARHDLDSSVTRARVHDGLARGQGVRHGDDHRVRLRHAGLVEDRWGARVAEDDRGPGLARLARHVVVTLDRYPGETTRSEHSSHRPTDPSVPEDERVATEAGPGLLAGQGRLRDDAVEPRPEPLGTREQRPGGQDREDDGAHCQRECVLGHGAERQTRRREHEAELAALTDQRART